MKTEKAEVDHYGAQYSNFASELYSRVRKEIFGVDLGQNGWMTVDEQDLFIPWLSLKKSSKLLDVATGSGGPALRIAKETGCSVLGIDIHEEGIAEARARAEAAELKERARFEQMDGAARLPFPDTSFDAVICIDAVNHLPGRDEVFREWERLLQPGGRVVFTDPIVITGPLTDEEMRIRSSIGFFLFVPKGLNEDLLERTGFEIVEVMDRTENMAMMARSWFEVRERHETDLRKIEGDETFEGQQKFFEVAARIAGEGRLSRFAYCARRVASIEA